MKLEWFGYTFIKLNLNLNFVFSKTYQFGLNLLDAKDI